MDDIDKIFYSISRRQQFGFDPLISCLYTDVTLPENCEPMLRLPEPDIGMALNDNLAQSLIAAYALNPSVHDGAIMIGRRDTATFYKIEGWSYRLFPPRAKSARREANRGSAFNSCLAMSLTGKVDCLYLVSKGLSYKFIEGRFRELGS